MFFKNYICCSVFNYSFISSHLFLEHLNNTFELRSSCRMELMLIVRRPKQEIFVIIFDSFHTFKIVTKSSTLYVADVLASTLITDIFSSQNWILINLKSIYPSCRNSSSNSNDKEDGRLLSNGDILISNSLRKQLGT